MLKHQFFQKGNFAEQFLGELRQRIEAETASNPLLKSLASQREISNTQNKKMREKEQSRQKDAENQNKEKKKAKKVAKDNQSKLHDVKDLSKKKEERTTKNTECTSSVPQCPSLLPSMNSTNSTIADVIDTSQGTKTEKSTSLTNIPAGKPCSREQTNSNLSRTAHYFNERTNLQDSFSRLSLKDLKEHSTNYKEHSTNTVQYSTNYDPDEPQPARTDTKSSGRMTLEMAINTPGKNLPELNNIPSR